MNVNHHLLAWYPDSFKLLKNICVAYPTKCIKSFLLSEFLSTKKNHGDVHSATIVFQQEYLLQTALTLICCQDKIKLVQMIMALNNNSYKISGNSKNAKISFCAEPCQACNATSVESAARKLYRKLCWPKMKLAGARDCTKTFHKILEQGLTFL